MCCLCSPLCRRRRRCVWVSGVWCALFVSTSAGQFLSPPLAGHDHEIQNGNPKKITAISCKLYYYDTTVTVTIILCW